jgi:hypothetical protein
MLQWRKEWDYQGTLCFPLQWGFLQQAFFFFFLWFLWS